jgi:hypothetical protein
MTTILKISYIKVLLAFIILFAANIINAQEKQFTNNMEILPSFLASGMGDSQLADAVINVYKELAINGAGTLKYNVIWSEDGTGTISENGGMQASGIVSLNAQGNFSIINIGGQVQQNYSIEFHVTALQTGSGQMVIQVSYSVPIGLPSGVILTRSGNIAIAVVYRGIKNTYYSPNSTKDPQTGTPIIVLSSSSGSGSAGYWDARIFAFESWYYENGKYILNIANVHASVWVSSEPATTRPIKIVMD